MNDKKRKNFRFSCSDESSELYTACREATRSDNTSRETVLWESFYNIILIEKICLYFNI